MKVDFKRNIPVFIITLLVFIIAYTNYKPNTWLTGWDNHHPEFNFFLNISRDLSTVWRENRGLGLSDGISHASDLPRELVLLFISLFVKQNFLRYLWHFLMLLLGPLGVYFLLVKKEGHNKWLSFVAASFYLLNFGTVQNFYTPLSTFTTFYGFLPWLVRFFLEFVTKGRKKSLVFFSLFSFFAAPFGYTATLYLVYLIVLTIILTAALLRGNIEGVKNSILAIFLSVLINSFWLFPFLYFTATKVDVVSNALVNRISSEEVYYRNIAYGNPLDLMLYKGYQFSARDLNITTGENELIYDIWWYHLDKPHIAAIGYLLFAIVLLGFFVNLNPKKNSLFYNKLVFLFAGFFLLGGTPFIGTVVEFVRDFLPVVGEAFRFPFTKLSIVLVFSSSILFYEGLKYFSSWGKKSKTVETILVIISFVLMISIVLPVFQGGLFYERMRVDIPEEYFSLFDDLERVPEDERILYLPLSSPWPWRRHSWGYVGSGFLRYGIKHPLIDRSFDMWSPYNENMFLEFKNAQLRGDVEEFRKLLDIYEIGGVLIDKTIVTSSISSKQNSDLFSFYLDVLDSQYTNDSHYGSLLSYYDLLPSYTDGDVSNTLRNPESLNFKYTTLGNDLVMSLDGQKILESDLKEKGTRVFKNIEYEVSLSRESEDTTILLRPRLPEIGNSSWEPYEVKLGQSKIIGSYLIVGNSVFGPIDDGFQGLLGVTNISESNDSVYLSQLDFSVSQDLIFGGSSPTLYPCGALNEGSYAIIRSDDSIDVNINNNTVCTTLPLSSGFTGEYILTINHTNKTNSELYYCLLDKSNQCIEGRKKVSADFDGIYKVPLNLSADISNLQLLFTPINVMNASSVSLKEVSITKNNVFVEVPGPSKNQGYFNIISEVIENPQFTLTDFVVPNFVGDRQCAKQMTEKYKKFSGSVEVRDDNLYINSLNTTHCAKFDPPLDSKFGNVVYIEIDNISGMTPLLCVRDIVEGNCVFEDVIRDGSNYINLPSLGTNSQYILELKNRSYSNIESENRIKAFRVYKYNYSYFESLKYNFDPARVITNGFSYDPGWVVLCGLKGCNTEQTLVENWQNGWVLENENVRFVFWPNALEYIGFALVLGSFAYVLNRKKS